MVSISNADATFVVALVAALTACGGLISRGGYKPSLNRSDPPWRLSLTVWLRSGSLMPGLFCCLVAYGWWGPNGLLNNWHSMLWSGLLMFSLYKNKTPHLCPAASLLCSATRFHVGSWLCYGYAEMSVLLFTWSYILVLMHLLWFMDCAELKINAYQNAEMVFSDKPNCYAHDN